MQHCGRFLGHVHQVRHRCLHAEGHFILADAGGDFRVADLGLLLLVELLDGVQDLAAAGDGVAGRVGKEQHRVAAGAELHALIDAWQEPRRPERRAGTADGTGLEHDIGRQIVCGRAKPVNHPRTDAGPAAAAEAGVQEHLRRGMIDLLGVQRADDAQLVGNAGQVRQQFGDLLAALPVRAELVLAAGQRHLAADESEALAAGQLLGAGFAVVFHQGRLRIEQVKLRRRADHVQVDDMLGPRSEVRPAHCQGIGLGVGGPAFV